MTSHAHEPVIRPASPEDAGRCGDIAVAAWQRVFDSWRAIIGDELWTVHFTDWEEDKRRQVEEHVREHTELAIVTEVEGDIVGFLTFRLYQDKPIGEIGNNAVDPACQGRGIGTRQCEHVLGIFRERGIVAAKVGTGLDEGHAPARAMYEKSGFDLSIPHVTYYTRV